MSDFFNNINTTDVEDDGDVLGGFVVHDSDAYEATIKVAYTGVSGSGAKFIGFQFDMNGKEYRENIHFTSGTEKGGEIFYVDKRSGKKKFLPGYTLVNDICLLTTGVELKVQPTEEKVLKLYSKEAKGDTNQSVNVLVDLIGKPIVLGILKSKVWKQVKQGDEYVNTDETREENSLNKVFHHETQGTVTEYTKDMPLGEFFTAWLDKNKGQVNDKTKNSTPAVGAGKPTASASGPANTTKSLFNKG